ncbi:hypothetical protein LX64_02982 [Chitinophaga skermanii]|uniref:Uncharacterized protein n=1 Tax=Chitinophaga skermanii TaxID=331697 RepID=A0A327QK79_9BACT|nr:hypothetical protein [Chitinophaga skermanii]RAJ04104.1 hypothetical protein LX64_02982 [Chitinophaga skermanii]
MFVLRLFMYVITCLVCTKLAAQSREQISMTFTQSSISIQPAQTVQAVVSFTNKSNDTIKGLLTLQCEGVELLSAEQKQIIIPPQSNKIHAFKIFAPNNLKASQQYSCRASLQSNEHSSVIGSATLPIYVNKQHKVWMIPQPQQPIIGSLRDTVYWQARIVNNGNSEESLQLNTNPLAGGFLVFTPVITFNLLPGHDTMLLVKCIPNQQFPSLLHPQVGVNLVDTRGINVAMAYFEPQVLSNYYRNTVNRNITQFNYVDVSSNNLFTNFATQELTVHSQFNTPRTNADLHLHGLYFYNTTQTALSDSYLFLRSGALFTRLGFIMQQGEAFVAGQGVTAGVLPNDHSSVAYTYINDNSNFLDINSKGYPSAPRVQSHSVNMEYSFSDTMSFSSQFVYKMDDRERVNGSLGSINFKFVRGPEMRVQSIFALSNEFDRDTKKNYVSAAAGLDFVGTHKQYDWLSSNYVSGDHYVGLRRGFKYFDERFGFTLNEKFRLGVRYLQQSLSPAYYEPLFYNFMPANDLRQTAEVNFQANITDRLRVVFRPYRFRQELRYDSAAKVDYISISNRAAVDVYWQGKKNGFLYLTYDVGRMNYEINDKEINKFWSHKANFSFTYKFFSVNGILQYSPYFLYEFAGKPRSYQYNNTYQIGPYVQKTLLKNHLYAMAGVQFLYQDIIGGWFTNYTARFNYEFLGRCEAHAFYTYMQQDYFKQHNLSVGLTYFFEQPIGRPTPTKTRLFFYRDDNNNNQRDEGEPPVEHVQMKLNGQTLVAGNQGVLKADKLPPGKYIAEVIPPNGMIYPPGQIVLHISKGEQIVHIPLKQGASIQGTVAILKGKYFNREVSAMGWQIIAKDVNNQPYQAFVSDDGSFHLVVPPGEYKLDVIPQQTPNVKIDIQLPKQKVSVQKGLPNLVKIEATANNGDQSVKHFGVAKER